MHFPLWLFPSAAQAAAVVFALCSATSQAAVSVLIQPGQDGQSVVWSVSWDSTAGNTAFPVMDLGFMDPATGEPLGNYLVYYRQAGWRDVGDYLKEIYDRGGDYAFVDGWYGVTADSAGWLVCAADDGLYDAIYIARWGLPYDGPFPETGSFALTVPGAHIGNYNPGTYTSNPNVTITVTTTPVPEPGLAAWLIPVAAMLGHGRRR